ncbi:MAG: valine--tRNA ligase [Flavobacteriaceae bacterium]
MDIPSKFKAQEVEEKWYQYWTDNQYFKSVPDDREPYTIVIPPPNVTGVLHMGHMLNNSLQDILIRRARMKGYNACWVPGTDHASIATEAKVVAKLKQEGIDKSDLSREAFLKHAWDWTHEYGGVILEQLKKLGCSCDWDRTQFTLNDRLSASVIKVFVDLYNKGFIYKGYRMVNWDPEAQTTLSDEEVIYEEKQGLLYYVSYPIVGSEEKITVATTRPETIFGDTAICIHPEDERYTELHGKKAIVPIVGREIPIILDTYVDSEFGTGCLKVTPAHDPNDKALGERHQLEVIDIFHSDGRLNEQAGAWEGQDRFKARKTFAKALEEKGFLVKKENHINKVGTSERTKAVIEPRLSDQWFLKMETLAEPALKAVLESEEVALLPKKFNSTYRHWMENIRDWNISRQLWWGHQIPAFYYGPGKEDFVVAATAEEALLLAQEKTANTSLSLEDLRQDEDVLDTWFSSWLWPISVFDGVMAPENEEINYYYPTQDLVTGPDILFFWVARMIVSGYELRAERPFENVYLTGLVRDKQGRKMSKQLGNSPDALGLIAEYGADSVRVGLMLSTAAGNDLLFDESLCQQGKNFSNKLWNAYRLIQSWEVSENPPSAAATLALDWYDNAFNRALEQVEDHFSKYRISDALMTLYKLVWDDYCSWLLESIKTTNNTIDPQTKKRVTELFEKNLRVLHPFMPFITEELWHFCGERSSMEALAVSAWPQPEKYDTRLLEDFDQIQQLIGAVRNFRKEKNLGFKETIRLYVTNAQNPWHHYEALLHQLGYIENIQYSAPDESQMGGTFRVGTTEFFIPLEGKIDVAAERKKLQEELRYAQGFLLSVEKKLSNERFVNNAPDQVVAIEKKKAADAMDKITVLKESLAKLSQ